MVINIIECERIIKEKIRRLKEEQEELTKSIINKLMPLDLIKKLDAYGLEIKDKPEARVDVKKITEDELVEKINELKRISEQLERDISKCETEDFKPSDMPRPKKRKPYRKRYTSGGKI